MYLGRETYFIPVTLYGSYQSFCYACSNVAYLQDVILPYRLCNFVVDSFLPQHHLYIIQYMS